MYVFVRPALSTFFVERARVLGLDALLYLTVLEHARLSSLIICSLNQLKFQCISI